MQQREIDLAQPNPRAGKSLSRFAFLIGNWRCEAKVKTGPHAWQAFPALWTGRCILDGYAIADEYRMTNASGDLVVLGMNFRTYDRKTDQWHIKWLNALEGSWTDLTWDEFGGVKCDGQSVSYAFREPMGTHAYTRARYSNISAKHFTWHGDQSDDGKKWSEFMVIEAYKDQN
jgi:hypothetical protein